MGHPEAPDEDRPPGADRASFRRSDFVLLRRAIRERWGVPDTVQTEAIFQGAKILADPRSDARDKIAVMRFLVSCTRADIADDARNAPRPGDPADPASEGVDPARALAALKALNDPEPDPDLDAAAGAAPDAPGPA